MGDLGYQAANISERELMAGYDAFLERKKECKFPLVSANLVFQSNGKPITAPYTLLTLEPKKYPNLKKPLKVAIAGVTRFNPTFLKGAPPKDNVIIANPVDEIKKYLPEMRRKADQVILLAAMSREDAHLLVKENPGIDLVLGGFGGMTTAVEEKEGSTAIFFIGNQGKYLAEMRMFEADGVTSLKSNLHYLNAAYPEDSVMKSRVDGALAEINNTGRMAAQLAQASNGSAAEAGDGEEVRNFLTAEACKECHGTEYAVWVESKHAHAMETLIHKDAEYNPECVGCHVVGFKRKGGFVDAKATPGMVNVQCEACHGPGARHVQNPGAPYGKAGKPSCVGCHNHENSPSFEYTSYWARIRHGA